MTTNDFNEILPLSLLEGEYSPRIRRNSGKIRFGYIQDPDDPSWIVAVPKEMEALISGLKFLKQGHSLRKVSRWIVARVGRPLDHKSLYNLFLTEQKIQRQRRALAAIVGLPDAEA